MEFGITKPGRRKVDKQTWLWTDDVKTKVRRRRSRSITSFSAKTDWRKYQEAKKAVAVAKATRYGDGDVNEKLESRDGERYLYHPAKNRHRQTENIEKFLGTNDEDGHLLMDRRKALKRWRDYFEKISTAEFPHPPILSTAPIHGPVQDHRGGDRSGFEEDETRQGKQLGPTIWRLIYGSQRFGTLLSGWRRSLIRL
ncbi:unnamed protein product [Heligmosomoides polygyrus]|uniref:Integrase_SAM-like_N domain-containing protein n=1 Tax=Heligmosomoides polygyrus TaxID=6339 RepID=A0A183G3X6_HELPZ|nr:unnamed protein product [Heligmosomoides polygyrus]